MSINDHPLTLELTSLRSALEKYQHAAHVSALQLQRAHQDATDVVGRVKQLESENDILRREVALLRSNVEPVQASRQATELSLALRRLSDKLSSAEHSLLEKTSECLQVTSALNRSKIELTSVQNHIKNNQALIEGYSQKEAHLNMRCKAAEEETKMATKVIDDYAALVRSLQRDLVLAKNLEKGSVVAAPPGGENCRSTAIFDSFQNSRNSLHQLLSEANAETSTLHLEISRLHNELSAARSDLEAEREVSRIDRQRLANALLEIERHKTNDMAAERMVSRYMRFSQSSIDALQSAVSTLKTRHAATLATLSNTSETLSKALEQERARISQMRDILDDLTESISRETYGRRREVSLRLRSLAREGRYLESLKGWIRRAEEQYSKITSPENATGQSLSSLLLSTYNMMIDEARNILISLNCFEMGTSDFESTSKILLADHLCSSLQSELQAETEKRLELVKILADSHVQLSLAPMSEEGRRNSLTPSNVPPGTQDEDLTACTNDSLVEPVDSSKSPSGPVESQVCNSGSVGQRYTESGPQRSSGERLAVESKWEELQKNFTDCHLALQQLRTSLLGKILDSQSSLLLNVVLRLDDYCEDARVELEIHVADLERVRRGVETIHNFASPAGISTSSEDLDPVFDALAVDAFETFQTKLSDLEHDIVQVKAALYNPASPVVTTIDTPRQTAWPFSSSSSDSSPYATPSFGTVITTPKPRRVYSLARYTSSHDSLSTTKDPYAHLSLRISMPSQHPPWESAPLTSPLGVKSNQLRITRSSSSLYRLGLHSASRIINDEDEKSKTLYETVLSDNDNSHVDVE